MHSIACPPTAAISRVIFQTLGFTTYIPVSGNHRAIYAIYLVNTVKEEISLKKYITNSTENSDTVRQRRRFRMDNDSTAQITEELIFGKSVPMRRCNVDQRPSIGYSLWPRHSRVWIVGRNRGGKEQCHGILGVKFHTARREARNQNRIVLGITMAAVCMGLYYVGYRRGFLSGGFCDGAKSDE
ncbi:hypothetical protein K440DRAFT_641561 [Wilcoxina mikolae CBS 423.85]|nr:hypothetical protein K440DRAFT_641561 [Wilcoxina mikolae CBS 423.85]